MFDLFFLFEKKLKRKEKMGNAILAAWVANHSTGFGTRIHVIV